VYGTLVQRTPAASAVVQRIVEAAAWRVLDLNLRPPHDGRDVTLASLARADFVKLNETEARRIAGWLGVAADPDVLLECLADRFGTTSLCITRGAHGALLWHDEQWIEQPAFPCMVADTIGAGDAFLAMVLAELLASRPAALAMERAAQLAAFVASRPGAVPDYAASRFRG
jgi:fructokinase